MSNNIKIAWETVEWLKVNKRVFEMQQRIYKTAQEGNPHKIHWLQRKLVKSIDARLLAVHIVTTNRGKDTAGIDKLKSLNNTQKRNLASKLKLDDKASYIRPVWIPKPSKTEMRPLGIPTIKDRAKQALCKLALEPQHEAYFEENSYGFRPGRSAHDAIEALFISLSAIPEEKTVLDADISKCFDQIDHEVLLAKTQTYPEMRNQINAWLKAGIMESFKEQKDSIENNQQGTPQGGVISPLLANIALHGLEQHLQNKFTVSKTKGKVSVIRYADDFVVLHRNPEIVKQCKIEAQIFLDSVGLKINEQKTIIKPASQGFNFLGFTLTKIKRQNGNYKTLIYASKKNQKRFSEKVRGIIQSNKSNSAYGLIRKLRPIVVGWANYYRYCECSTIFSKMDNLILHKLRAWMFRRDNRSRELIKEKYFPSNKTYIYEEKSHKDNWVFYGETTGKDGKIKTAFLPHMSWVSSKKFVKVKQNKSPYDGDSLYWTLRTSKYTYFSCRLTKLIQLQKGKCPLCNRIFMPTDFKPPETDHILPTSQGGKDHYNNLQAVHYECHLVKTAKEKHNFSRVG